VSGAFDVLPDNRGFGVANRGHLVLDHSRLSHTYGLLNSGGVAVVRDSSVTDNMYSYVGAGGGIQNRNSATLTVTNSVISENGAYFRGGGIYNDSSSSATLTDSIVSGNRITYEGNGGGIMNYGGTLLLVGTTVADNTATYGGGIWNKGTAMIRRSTISGNRLDSPYEYFNGGGIDNLGKLTLVNSTVSNNQGRATGGGISNLNNGTLAILSSTVTGNTAATRSTYYEEKGGGIMAWSGTLTLQRSIVSGNNASTVPEISVQPGVTVTANDFNVFGHDGDAGVAGFTPGSTDIVPNKSIGGILLPLADNGGPTRTHALAMNSPALDASPDDESCPAVDQRGSPRPRGPACDIGSFEGAAVLCNGRTTTQVGTDGDDELTGTPGPDVIAGLNGDDAIAGLEGNDVLCAGGGNDTVFGSAGNDALFGQGGNDRLLGHRGSDTLDGGNGQDQCDGGADADTATACETVNSVP
jgi:hypothetical protein